MVPRKGFDHILAGWKSVLADHPDAHFMIIGDGPIRQELQKTVDEAGIGHSVTLTGPVSNEDLIAAYRSAELFIMPNTPCLMAIPKALVWFSSKPMPVDVR